MTVLSSFDLPDFANRPSIHRFINAWDKWRGDAMIPNRRDVKLSDIQSIASGMVIFDMYSHSNIRCRFIGSMFTDLYGHDYTGKNYLDITEPSVRKCRAERMFSVVEQPCIAAWAIAANAPLDPLPTTVGVSVPIAPKNPDHPMQLMQMMEVLTHVNARVFQQHGDELNIHYATSFIGIDIGAGTPVYTQTP